MPSLPKLNHTEQRGLFTNIFAGYNHNDVGEDGEMWDMKNLTSDGSPILQTRSRRQYPTSYVKPAGLITNNGLCVVQDNMLCLGQREGDKYLVIPYDLDNAHPLDFGGTDGYTTIVTDPEITEGDAKQRAMRVTDGQKQLVNMGAYICVFPDKLYFNTSEDPNDGTDRGSMEHTFTGDGVTMELCRMDGSVYRGSEITVSATQPQPSEDNPIKNGALWLNTANEDYALMMYNENYQAWEVVDNTYIRLSAPGIGNGFSEYDGVTLSGLSIYREEDDDDTSGGDSPETMPTVDHQYAVKLAEGETGSVTVYRMSGGTPSPVGSVTPGVNALLRSSEHPEGYPALWSANIYEAGSLLPETFDGSPDVYIYESNLGENQTMAGQVKTNKSLIYAINIIAGHGYTNDKAPLQLYTTFPSTNVAELEDNTEFTILSLPSEISESSDYYFVKTRTDGKKGYLRKQFVTDATMVQEIRYRAESSSSSSQNAEEETSSDTVEAAEHDETYYETAEEKAVASLNGAAVIYALEDDYIVVAGAPIKEKCTSVLTTTVSRTVPDMDYVCEAGNRLWGCRFSADGDKIINEIYCSALGDFKNWNRFIGLTTDSYTVTVGKDGPFTGCGVIQGSPVFFKEKVLYRISGLVPEDFSVSETICEGVQNGSWRSVVNVDEYLFYKSRGDVMVYDGSYPESVSAKLGNVSYSNGIGGTAKHKYYISMQETTKDGSGAWHLFVYDMRRQLWHREDDYHALAFLSVGEDLWSLAAYESGQRGGLWAMRGESSVYNLENYDYSTEYGFTWSSTFAMYGYDVETQKYISRFNLRCWCEGSYLHPESGVKEECYVKVELQYDSDGEWHNEGVYRVPVIGTRTIPVVPRRCDHLQLRLSGKGQFKLFSIGRVLETGGDVQW